MNDTTERGDWEGEERLVGLELNVRGICGAAIGNIGDPLRLGVELTGLSTPDGKDGDDELINWLENDDWDSEDSSLEE
jgi:hypothetical protein